MTAQRTNVESARASHPAMAEQRGWRTTALVLALLLFGLGSWVYDRSTAAGIPGDVEQVIADYLMAFEQHDETTLRALVTQDFRSRFAWFEEGVGSQTGRYPAWRGSDTIEGVVEGIVLKEWQTERPGRPVVSGDGPWFVAVEENWTNCSLRDSATGECNAFVAYPGVAIYSIVEEDGVLKVADYFWAGMRE